jgi:SAM-dependent methyltransferase
VGLTNRAFNSLRRLGFRRSLQTAASMVEDQLFDLRFGTDTNARVLQSGLQTTHPEHQAFAAPYFVTRARALRHIFRASGVPLNRGLVDVGSGKGKVLIVAARYGFTRVTGIEFAPALNAAAQNNLRRISHLLPAGAQVSSHCADATVFPYDPRDSVFFLFNPFRGVVMERFCARLAASLAESPRPLWMIYADPSCAALAQSALQLAPQHRSTYGGFEFVVLANAQARNWGQASQPAGSVASASSP